MGSSLPCWSDARDRDPQGAAGRRGSDRGGARGGGAKDAQMHVSERGFEEEDHDREQREQEARDGELGDLVEAELGEARLDHDDDGADPECLHEQQADREGDVVETPVAREPPRDDEHVHQNREEDQLLDA
ncbi:MAG: hypothetical protein ABSE20_28890 [Acetobacteraceae bacterium]